MLLAYGLSMCGGFLVGYGIVTLAKEKRDPYWWAWGIGEIFLGVVFWGLGAFLLLGGVQ